MPSLPSVSVPKGPAPVKIDVSSGAGAPGGFSSGNLKSPSTELAKLNAGNSAIAARKANLQAAAKAGQPVDPESIKKLDAMQAQNAAKAKTAGKVPDYSKNTPIPQPPSAPAVPDFDAAGIQKPPVVPGSIPEVAAPTITEPNIDLPIDASGQAIEPPDPPAPPPTPAEEAKNSADDADVKAAAAGTPKAKKAAKSAKNQAKKAQNQEDQANKFLDQAKEYEDQAAKETNPVTKANLQAKADKLKKKAEPHQAQAEQAKQKAKNFDAIVQSEYNKAQGTA